ncbi:unnamed protein product, partial [Cuscuta campestris]
MHSLSSNSSTVLGLPKSLGQYIIIITFFSFGFGVTGKGVEWLCTFFDLEPLNACTTVKVSCALERIGELVFGLHVQPAHSVECWPYSERFSAPMSAKTVGYGSSIAEGSESEKKVDDDDGVDDSKETEIIIYYHEEEDVIIIAGTKKTQLMLDDGQRYEILAIETSLGIYKPWDPKTDVMKFMQPTSDVNSSVSEINSKAHLFQHGIDESYTCWIWHGELNPDDEPPHPHNKRVHDSFDDGTEENSEEDGEDRSFEYSDFMNHVQGDSEPLYPGCKTYTKLKALVILYNLKAKHGISDSCFSEILLLLGTFLPKGNCLPSSFGEAKKTLCAL